MRLRFSHPIFLIVLATAVMSLATACPGAAPTAGTEPEDRVGISYDWRPMPDPARAAADAGDRRPGTVWTEPATGMEFVWIPAGCFLMGSPPGEPDRYHDEGPQHEVCLDGFWMGRYEVTNAQFKMFAPSHHSREYEDLSLNEPDQPVVHISWQDAMAFCFWLAEQNHGRYCFWLPTEAQWEYACRAGTTTSRFYGTDKTGLCAYANLSDEAAQREWDSWSGGVCDDGFAVTAPVGSYAPNPWGLHDVLGNAWEWCADWKGKYPDHPVKNPLGPSASTFGRIVRGGSWDNGASGVRPANRSFATTRFTRYNIGFRVVRIR